MNDATVTDFARQLWTALDGNPECFQHLHVMENGHLPSVFAVSELASASVGVAGLALAELLAVAYGEAPAVQIDQRLASFWFASSIRPQGWALPPIWDAIAGDYQTSDGWIRLHTNAPKHRDAALAVLGTPAEKTAVAAAVAKWRAQDLETAIVNQHGCAAAMRDQAAWTAHPQGVAVNKEPLLHTRRFAAGKQASTRMTWTVNRARPLQGVRVLDLTRILAGPVATRFLAGFGADVLRIDPLDWDEPSLVPELTVGKRCARLDLKTSTGRQILENLLREADVLVHGYRADALEKLGLGTERRRELNPALIDVSLNAYGWSGPWQCRRGFDSLVQMSCGIADFGMRTLGKGRPAPLPVQALDQATGYLLAAAAIKGLTYRYRDGKAYEVRTSLARTAVLLMPSARTALLRQSIAPETLEDRADAPENTAWGVAYRLQVPLQLHGAAMHWSRPAGALGSAAVTW